jgi:hypothetical protein
LWVRHASDALVLEPWKLAHFTLRQYQLQLLLRLAGLVLPAARVTVQAAGQSEVQASEQQRVLWQLTDGLLAVLPLSAPGQEQQALQALLLLFDQEAPAAAERQSSSALPVPGRVLAAAVAAVQGLADQGGPLAAAAAGLKADSTSVTAGTAAPLPYPPPGLAGSSSSSAHGSASADGEAAFCDAAAWAKLLLEGYSVAWLSVIAAAGSSQQQQQAGAAAIVLPRQQLFVAESEGSRLPVPPEWPLAEILAVPSADRGSSSSCQQHPVAAALLLALGLEQPSDIGGAQSRYMSVTVPGRKLEALLQLLYTFDAGELLHQPGAQQLAPAWQDAAARWAAAVLSEQYSREAVAAAATAAAGASALGALTDSGSSSSGCRVRQLLDQHMAAGAVRQQQQQQPPTQQVQRLDLFPSWATSSKAPVLLEKLVLELSEVSFGDPLFGAHVTLLLLPAAGARLQRGVWGALVDHSALHLLPPPWRCIGGAAAYLGVQVEAQPSSDSSGDSSSLGPTPPAGWFDAQLVADMGKALAHGDLTKALQLQGLAGLMALHGVAALCLDQAAWQQQQPQCQAGGSTGDVGPQATAADVPPAPAAAIACNVLRGVLRGCDAPLLQQLLAAGRCRGQGSEAHGRALVQAAHGDAALMEKVRRLLAGSALG